MKERSLIVFTILSQMAAGVFWTFGAVYAWSARQAGLEAARALALPGWISVGVAMAFALLASLFHLGTPTMAWRALGNLRRSWLSREILCATGFTGASILYAGLQWLNRGAPAARDAIGIIAGLAGLALVYAMGSAYRLRTVPAWTTWVTSASFFVTPLLLGAAAASTVLVLESGQRGEWSGTALHGIAVWAVALLGIELVLVALWLSQLTGSQAARRSAARITSKYGTALQVRVALAVAAILIMGAMAFQPCANCLPPRALSLIAAFGLVLASEVLGRLLFYAARVRLGV